MPHSYDLDMDDSARARRRRASSSSSSSGDISVKALGANLGDIAKGRVVFDPNAYDGDGDGLVQDGTPFERPAALSNVAALARGFASATGKWGDSFDNWTAGKTNEEIAEVLVPDNPADLLAYFAAHIGAHGYPLGVSYMSITELAQQLGLASDDVDFSPESIALARKTFADMLYQFPQMKALLETHGHPPIIVSKEHSYARGAAGSMSAHAVMTVARQLLDEIEKFSSDEQLREKISVKLYSAAVDNIAKRFFGDSDWLYKKVPALVRQNFDGDFNPMLTTLIHEYGHYLHYNAALNHPDPTVRRFLSELLHRDWHNIDPERLPKEWADFVQRITMDRYALKEANLPPSELVPPSLYGLVNPKEFIAETFTAAFTGNDVIDKPRQDLIENISATRPYPNGFASRSGRPEHLLNAGPQRIAEMVVPENAEQARAHLLDNLRYIAEIGGIEIKGTDDEIIAHLIKSIGKEIGKPDAETLEDVFSFAPEDLASIRKAIENRLAKSPLMMAHTERFGMPPVMAVKSDGEEFDAFMSVQGAPLIAFSTRMLQEIGASEERAIYGTFATDHSPRLDGTDWWLVSGATRTLESTLAHEYGHYLNYMVATAHPDSHTRALAAFWWAQKWEDLTGGRFHQYKVRRWKKKNPGWELSGDTADRRFGNVVRLVDAIKNGESLDMWGDLPFVSSQYGQSMPMEMFAEAYGAMTSGDPEQVQRVSMEMANDIAEMLGPMSPRAPQPIERIVDTTMGDTARSPGFASLSISRDARGDRNIGPALLLVDDSPLVGVDWLKNATNEEIAQALVPRSPTDAARLIAMNMLYGDTVPNRQMLTLAMITLESWLDPRLNGGVDLIDFSPTSIARMEHFVKSALDNSPEFAWMVRRFGSPPFLPSNPALINHWGLVDANGNRIHQWPNPVMEQLGEGLLGGGTMGYAVGDAFIVLNTSFHGWDGWHDPSIPMPVFGTFDRRLVNHAPTFKGNRYVGNFGTSVEGTIVHEWAHTLWARFFGDSQSIGRGSTLISGDRFDRGAYLFPNLPLGDAVQLMGFGKDTFSETSFSTLYAGHDLRKTLEWQDELIRIKLSAERIYGANSTKAREVARRLDQFDLTVKNNGRLMLSINNYGPNATRAFLDPRTADNAAYFVGWDADLTEETWKLLANDFPEVFGNPDLDIVHLKNRYAQKNAQESWAELVALAGTPDQRMKQKYLTPGLQATLGYMLGEHGDPVNPSGLILPWSTQPRGFASRAERIDVARSGVGMRASNADAIVHAMSVPENAVARDAVASVEDTGMINIRVGDYSFSVPGEQYMPRFNSAYTEWASENHRSMQAISSMMMGIPDGHGLLNNGPITEMNEFDKANIRTSAARAVRLMEDIKDSDVYSSYPLFHTVGNITENDQLLKASVGDSIHLPLVSFTPEHVEPSELTNGFAERSIDNSESAIIKLGIGAKIVDSDITKNGYLHDEWRKQPLESITNGKFRITNIDELNGSKLIEVEHTDVFNPYKSSFEDVKAGDWEDNLALNNGWRKDLRKLEDLNRQVLGEDVNSQTGDNQKEILVQRVLNGMFGNETKIPEPKFSLSPDNKQREEALIQSFIDSRVPSSDTRGLPGFASLSDRENGFNRVLRPEQRVSKSARRMLEENREYIIERQMSSREGGVIDGEWIDNVTERLRNGEITHQEAMDLMNVLMDVMGDRIRNNPSERDATEGDMYHYQKLGKRLRRMMVAGVSDEDMDRIRREQGIRGRGFASSYTNVSDELVKDFNPRVVHGAWDDGGGDDDFPDKFQSRRRSAAVVYKINDENVTFGLTTDTSIKEEGLKNVPLNPYEITGLERGSKAGEEMALKWLYANASQSSDYETNGTEVSALLYAGVRGDKQSMEKFEELAKTGEQRVKEMRQKLIDDYKSFEISEGEKYYLNNVTANAIRAKAKSEGREISFDEAQKLAKETKFSVDNLAVVRWTEFPPEYDEEGNVILHPLSHYSIIDNDGQQNGIDRETIHFTLNHTVQEHMFWQAQGGGYSIIVPLKDLMEDNPDSLDALKSVDTYFTPAPGKGLKLRKGSVRVVKVDDPADRAKLTNQNLEEMGFLVVAGGPHYSDTQGFDHAVTMVEKEFNRPRSLLHGNMPHHHYEKLNAAEKKHTAGQYAGTSNITPYFLAQMDRNALLRLTDKKHHPLIGEARIEVRPPGGFRLVSTNRAPQGIADLARTKNEIKLANEIQEQVDRIVANAVQEQVDRARGFASRTDTVSVQKSFEEIADELELNDKEKSILEQILPPVQRLLDSPVHPSLEKDKEKIINSIRVGVGDDGIPFIFAEPHPFLKELFPDQRDWGAVMAPTEENREKIKNMLEEAAAKLLLRRDSPEYNGLEGAKRFNRSLEVEELFKAFGKYAMSLYDGIAARNPISPEDDRDTDVSPLTWVGQYLTSIHNLSADRLRMFFGDNDFLNAHDLLGHMGTGRAYDRHGEWANMLAMFSLMDRWAEENNIPNNDLLSLKARWFVSLEQHRLPNRFSRDRSEASPHFPEGTEWWDREDAISALLSGLGDEEELTQIVAALDDGNKHSTARSRGFASLSSTERGEFAKRDMVRNSTITRRSGFASKTSDWTTGTHGIELKPNIPNSEIAHAKDSATTQMPVPVGNEVIHPRTGEKIKLDSIDKSVDFVSFGGNISDVPDEHVVESILRNTDNIPGERQSGWMLSKANARFEFIASGGGMHGMLRLKDSKTGAMFGIKFEASSNFAHNDEIFPITHHSNSSSIQDVVKEATANSFLEQLGYPPMPIRIVRRSNLGAGEEDPNKGMIVLRHGVAFITELAHNRHSRIIGNGDVIYNNNQALSDLDAKGVLRMRLLDSVIHNLDRNGGNYLLSAQSNGSIVPIPIDHGLSLGYGTDSIEMIIGKNFGEDSKLMEALRGLSKDELSGLITEVMMDYREEARIKQEKIIEESRRAIEQTTGILSSIPDTTWSSSDSAYMDRDISTGVELAMKRWDDLIGMSDDEIADIVYEALRAGRRRF